MASINFSAVRAASCACLDFGQQHHEFVASLAADGIGEADARLQALGDRLQQLVADRMPERIVDVLEVVEVQIHQGDLLAMTLRERDRLRQAVGQQRTVRQSREKVVLGHIGHLRGGLLGGLGHRLGTNRRDDEALVRFPQLRLAMLALPHGGRALAASSCRSPTPSRGARRPLRAGSRPLRDQGRNCSPAQILASRSAKALSGNSFPAAGASIALMTSLLEG